MSTSSTSATRARSSARSRWVRAITRSAPISRRPLPMPPRSPSGRQSGCRSRRGQGHRVGRQEPEEPQLVAADVEQLIVGRARGRLAVGGQDIGPEPGIARGADPLACQIRPEIVLVIAQDRHLNADRIRELDHLLTPVSPESTEGEIRSPPKLVTLFGLRARSWRKRVMNSAKPPCAVLGCYLVDVVAVQERDRRGRRPHAAGSRQSQGCRRQRRAEQDGAPLHAAGLRS